VGRSHDLASRVLAAASGPSGAQRGEGIDPLSDVLRAVRLTGALFFRIEATSPWLAAVPEAAAFRPLILAGTQHVISYHVVTRGGCWAGLGTDAGVRVEAGDIIVIPNGDAYLLSTMRGANAAVPLDLALAFFRDTAGQRLLGTIREGGGRRSAVDVVCGFLGCDVVPYNPVLAALPALIHLRSPASPAEDRLSHLLEFALAESCENRAGRDCVLLRISELMFVEMLRRYLAALPPEQTGWLAGLRDPVVGRALALLHEQPAHPWTLAALARAAGLSRSVLAERFTHFVGQPPMQYLARWRMQRAAGLLADGAPKVAAVAFDVGYDSEAAFSRAFKKAVGVPPAAWRDRHAVRT
jgi:AraC-like DNA-binding protein